MITHLSDHGSRIGTAVAAILFTAGFAGIAAADSLAERANRGLVEIITGSVYGSAPRMAEDLASLLDDGATRRVLPVIGKGSLQNLVDLRALRGADLAIVQSDVLDYAKSQKLFPGADAGLTYIAKLYNEELHLLARGDVKTIADLVGKRVSIGLPGDGTALTATRIFEVLKIRVEALGYDPATALQKLRSGEIDAMVFVAAKPAPFFATLRAEDGLHLVPVPLKADLAETYLPARLQAEDYPLLLGRDGAVDTGTVDTVAVGTVLVAANLAVGSERYRNVANFVDAFFTQFPHLLDAPHQAKWSEVSLTAELPGWRRFAAADGWIKRNGAVPTVMNEQQLHDIFSKFLDERSRIAGGQAMSAQQKQELFDQFKRWQVGHAQ